MSHAAELSPTPFGRLLTAMVTPFDLEGQVDLATAGRLARFLVEEGSEGLVVCGTTGESPTLSWREQIKMLEAVRQSVGSDVMVLAGTGSNSTSEAVKATREAAAAGADGALVVVPYYNKPPQEGLLQHHLKIARPFSSDCILSTRAAADALQRARSYRHKHDGCNCCTPYGLLQCGELQGG